MRFEGTAIGVKWEQLHPMMSMVEKKSLK